MIAIRSAYLTFTDDPFVKDLSESMVYESDGLILIEDGKIAKVGPAQELLLSLPEDIEVHTYKDSLVVPGFIDSHVHYAQTEMIAAYGEQLLDWLNNYTFIAEQGFADKEHATEIAEVFVNEQIKNGVTSSVVYGTVFPQSVDALFEVAEAKNMRLMTGKVCMDRNAPEPLLDTAQRAYDESKALLEKWNNKGRLEYVITPRFAPTSTPEQLAALGELAREYPDVLIQTHLSENLGEVEWVKELFPEREGYLDVYDHYGLVRERSVFGHCIHLTDKELQTMSDRGATIAHCPTSNFFLGSGYFDIFKALDPTRPVRVGMGTDLGAGTSFSMLATLNEAYKAAQLNNKALSAPRALYAATRGTARSLYLEDKIGSIEAGYEADLAVIDLHSTPIIDYRMKYAKDIEEVLFIQLIMGDDRAISATYIDGKRAYSRES